MKKLISLLTLTMISATLLAVPAKRVRKTITLADGTTREVVLRGDENVHFYQAEDGSTFQLDHDNIFKQVDAAQLQATWQQKLEQRNAPRRARAVMRKATWGAETNPISGHKKGLVILVNFSDKSMATAHDNTFFNRFFNEEGFSESNMGGSVHDYFYDQSYGQFDLDFDVIGPVTVSKAMSYYGANDTYGSDEHPAEMVIEAVKLADAQGVDFSQYDWDDDGIVDQVFVVYAGYGEAQGASENTIWPHEYDLASANYYGDGTGALKLDGVWINTYACSCECHGTTGSNIDGIGTACHEFSHCMALPDLYDTGSSGNVGMDIWDLLDYGCYEGPNFYGECPTGYTSYERMYCGWLTPKELTEYTEVDSLKSLADAPDAYIIYNKKNKSEYYLLENRQLSDRWFQYEYGHGMLVLHVDFSSSAWSGNTVNNEKNHERMVFIPADNSRTSNPYSSSTYTGDPFPGTKKKTELTNTSVPVASLYNNNSDGKKFMNFPIRNIAENNGIISFTAGDVNLDAPVAKEGTDITSTGFTASWDAVDMATSYEVTLVSRDTSSTSPTQALLLSEDFSGFNNAGTSVGTQDISGSLDSYTQTTGWSGSKLYTCPSDEVKFGSSSAAGKLVTPAISAPSTGAITVVVKCRAYSTDSGTLGVTVKGATSSATLNKTIGTITPQTATTTTVLNTTANQDFTITLATSVKRAYVSDLEIYDGTFTADDLANRAPRRASGSETYTTADTHYTFTNLNPALYYSYKVRANYSIWWSDYSNLMSVLLDGQTDAIEEVKSSESGVKSPIYDLQGRRLSEVPQHGLYIVNGKKILR